MSDKRENLISIRVRNAQLECALASASARCAVRRIRTGLSRRGLTTAQREEALHDTLLMMAEVEAAGADPVEALLGDANVSAFDAGIESYCDGVAGECPLLPTALVIVRFCALMLVALAIVLGSHLAYRIAMDPPGGWLPFYNIDLRMADISMLRLEVLLVPALFLAAQIVSSLIPRNPWIHALPVIVTPVLFFVLLMLVTDSPTMFPGGLALYNPLDADSLAILQRQLFDSAVVSEEGILFVSNEGVWFIANRFALMGGVVAMAVAGLAITYLIERRNPHR